VSHLPSLALKLVLGLLVLLFAAGASAQEIPAAVPDAVPVAADSPKTGTIRGAVVDRDGAVYQGVRVALTATGQPPAANATTITDSSGRFEFGGLNAGSFQITVSSQGFATQSVTVLLQAGEIVETKPIMLPVSATETDVRVTASRADVAQAQLQEEEKQRVFGVLPNFYISYAPDAQPLKPKQKFNLFWKSTIDPVTFIATGIFAGIEQAQGDFKGYGQGTEGYAKRYAANYADNFIGSAIGSAILPSLLKQDPRYFYKGTGSIRSRVGYAIAMSVVAKGDNGHWQPNYSGVLGGLAGAGISNLYYPAADRNGAALTFENLGLGTAESALQNLLQEFLIRKLTPKIPKYSQTTP
jgi:Carboxypeptidase regulatory-like domain